jgi:hypothetical protein
MSFADKFHVEDRVHTELWTLFAAKAVKDASPTHNNARNVSTPPEPAIEQINTTKGQQRLIPSG